MTKRGNSLNISARSFLMAILIIFLLMALTYALTFLIPGGEYARTVDQAGHTIIDTQAGFRPVPGGLPLWKWLLSPVLVLGAEGSGALLAVIAFCWSSAVCSTPSTSAASWRICSRSWSIGSAPSAIGSWGC